MLKTCPVCGATINYRRSLCAEHLKEYGSKSLDWPYWLYMLVKDQNKQVKRESRHQELPFTDETFYPPSETDRSSFDGKDEFTSEYWAGKNETRLASYDSGNRLVLRGLAIDNNQNPWSELPPSFRNSQGQLIIPVPKNRKRKSYIGGPRVELPADTIEMLQQIQEIRRLLTDFQFKVLIMHAHKYTQAEIASALNMSQGEISKTIASARIGIK